MKFQPEALISPIASLSTDCALDKRGFFIFAVLLFTIGLFSAWRYTDFGESISTFSGTTGYTYEVQAGASLLLPHWVRGVSQVTIEINSTEIVSLRLFVEDRLAFERTGTIIRYVGLIRNETWTLSLSNISPREATVYVWHEYDGKPLQREQILWAPFFSVLPELCVLLVSLTQWNKAVIKSFPKLRFHHIYLLLILPILSLTMIMQLAVMQHSVSGVPYMPVESYFTDPIEYFQNLLRPSYDLALLWMFAIGICFAFLAMARLIRFLYSPFSRLCLKISNLVRGTTFSSYLLYYYTFGGFFAVILLNMRYMAPEEITNLLPVQSLGVFLRAIGLTSVLKQDLWFFFSFPLGVALAVAMRLFIAEPGVKRTTVVKVTKSLFITTALLSITLVFQIRSGREDHYIMILISLLGATFFFSSASLIAIMSYTWRILRIRRARQQSPNSGFGHRKIVVS